MCVPFFIHNFTVGLFYHCLCKFAFNCFKRFTGGPDIWIEGTEKAVCGSTAHFQATVKEKKVSYLSVNWQKLSKYVSTQIDKSNERFSGKTNKELFIESVCKKDEGEYQAVLSIEEGRTRKTIQSNIIFMHVVGGMTLFNGYKFKINNQEILLVIHGH